MYTRHPIKRRLYMILFSSMLFSFACSYPESAADNNNSTGETVIFVEISQTVTEPIVEEPVAAIAEPSAPTTTEIIAAPSDPTPPESSENLIPAGQITLPEVRLPQSAIDALQRVAQDNGLMFAELAAENTVIYALPASDDGVVFLLTPTIESRGFSTKELAGNPGLFQNIMLGGLTVVRQVNSSGTPLPPLPQGDYVITLSADGSKVVFTTGIGVRFEFNVVIRSMPRRLPRPVALITASQMCLAWDVTQVCALIDNLLPGPWRNQLETSIVALQRRGVLQGGAENFILSRAIPDIEGVQGLQRCVAMDGSPSNYASCYATVLAASAVRDGAFPVPGTRSYAAGNANVTGIGLLVTLENIQEEISADPYPIRSRSTTETIPANSAQIVITPTPIISPSILPRDDYLVYEIASPGDPQIARGIFERRGLILSQLSTAGDFYIPIVSGAVIVGNSMQGIGPSGEDEAVIANLWYRRRCFFKQRQCRWVR